MVRRSLKMYHLWWQVMDQRPLLILCIHGTGSNASVGGKSNPTEGDELAVAHLKTQISPLVPGVWWPNKDINKNKRQHKQEQTTKRMLSHYPFPHKLHTDSF
jgi:hypothetical protein